MTDYARDIGQIPAPAGFHEDRTLQELQDLVVEQTEQNEAAMIDLMKRRRWRRAR